MASYDHKFTIRIPHVYRMALGILADAEGSSISAYVRRLIERYADDFDTVLTTEHDPAVWQRVEDLMQDNPEGPDAFISVRVAKETLTTIDDVAVYSRATLINAIIKGHIINNLPKKCKSWSLYGADYLRYFIKLIKKIIS